MCDSLFPDLFHSSYEVLFNFPSRYFPLSPAYLLSYSTLVPLKRASLLINLLLILRFGCISLISFCFYPFALHYSESFDLLISSLHQLLRYVNSLANTSAFSRLNLAGNLTWYSIYDKPPGFHRKILIAYIRYFDLHHPPTKGGPAD